MILTSTTAAKTPALRRFGNFGRRHIHQYIKHIPHRHLLQLTAAVLLTTCLQAGSRGYGQTITLSVKNTPLEKVFSMIQKQSGFTFAYTREVLQQSKNVDIQVKNAPLQKVLDICFMNQPLAYTILDRVIIIKAKVIKNNYQEIATPLIDSIKRAVINGKVLDSNKIALPGATVINKNTKQTTLTDDDGEFEIVARKGDILEFSYVGMQTRQITIGNASIVVVNLGIDVKIEDIVTIIRTGYQTISKERIVGSFSQLDSEAYHRRTGMDILSRLDGTVTGVLFDKKGEFNPIQIRGISTLKGNTDPLIIVDNFPFTGDIHAINPNDVENISVLKDAATASIWGTRAGNGVIVITTKRAKYNQPFRISVGSNITIQEKPNLYYAPQMTVLDFLDVEQLLFSKGFYDANLSNTNQWPAVSPVVEILARRRAGLISVDDSTTQINALKGLNLRNDLNTYVYRPSVAQQHYANFSYGNNIINYQFSAGYNRTMPNVKGSKPNDQYTFSSNTNFRPLKDFEIQANVNFSQETIKTVDFSLPTLLYPYAQLADSKGIPLSVPNRLRTGYLDTAGKGQLLDWHYRPLDEVRLADNASINRFVRVNLGISYRLTNWLNAEIKYQLINQSLSTRRYYSQETYFTRNLINLYTNLNETTPDRRYPVPIGGILDLANGQTNSYNARCQLNINKNWGNHIIIALIAGEISEARSSLNTNTFYGYDDEIASYKSAINYQAFYPLYFDPRTTVTIPQGSIYNEGTFNRFVALLANVSYTYNDRYTIYASARRDGANIFGVNTNNKWKPLWSTGISWDISKEPFYSLDWLPYLRLSASYGFMGNVNNGLSGLPTILYPGDGARYTNLTRAQIGSAPNPDLRWEQIKTFKAGIDFSLMKNRLSGTLEVFNKTSTDLISEIPFDPTSGVNTYVVNAASLKGNGWELSLNSRNTTGTLKWETSIGLYYVKMIVTKLHNGGFKASDFIAYSLNPAVGKVAYGISSYRWAGLDPISGDPQGFLNKKVSKDYIAIFNDSIQNQIFHGSSRPLYSGFLKNTLSFKNFSISANITCRFKYYFRKPTINYNRLFSMWDGHSDYASRWQKSGDEKITTTPSLIYPNNPYRDDFYQSSEVNVLKGDNIRVQDIRLQYSWNNRSYKRVPIKTAQLFLYSNNLNIILWRANKSNLDPDFSGGSSNPLAAPIPRTWTIGINLNF